MSEDRHDDGGLLGLLISIVGTLGVIGIAVLVWALLIKPANTNRAKTERRAELSKTQLETAKKDLEKADSRRGDINLNIRRLKRKLEKSKRKSKPEPSREDKKTTLSRVKRLIGQEGALDDTIGRLKRMARNQNVLVRKMAKAKTTKEGLLHVQPINIELTGRFSDVVTWLKRATTESGRVIVTDSTTLTPLRSPAHAFAKPDWEEEVGLRLRLKGTLDIWTLAADTSGAAPKLFNRELVNDRWATVRGSFWAFSATDLEDKRNPYESRLHLFHQGHGPDPKGPKEPKQPEPKQPEPEKPEPKAPDPAPKAPEKAATTPLTKHPVEKYSILGVVKRAEVMVAVVMAPDGTSHIVKLDTKLGNGGGVVTHITSKGVVIDEPSRDAPLTLSIDKD